MPSKLPFAQCDICPLYANVAVPGDGPYDTELVIVGEAPGANEEAQGLPFVGQSGALLEAGVEQAGSLYALDMFYKTNVVACRPPHNRTPTQEEISCCRPRLLHELSLTNAKKVMTLGNTAHEAFNVDPGARGAVFERDGRMIIPNWHPAYVLRAPDEASEFLQIVDRALNGPMQVNYISAPEIRMIDSLELLKEQLALCPDNAWVAFDIETDQVQWYPTKEASRDSILMMQLAWTEEFAIVMCDDMLYDEEGAVEELQHFFNRIQTVAHNGKFDVVFLHSHLGLEITQNFDTLLAHYTLDENSKHGLKRLSRIEFGLEDYEERIIKKYLSSSNDRYSKIPTEDLALYGGWDVIATLKLRELYEQRLRKEGMFEWPFQNILMEAANTLAVVQERGTYVDVQQLDNAAEQLASVLQRLRSNIQEMTGIPALNPNSAPQLKEALFVKLGLPMIKTRKAELGSTNHEVLEKLQGKHPVIDELLKHRRVQKIKGSYVDNIRYYIDIHGRVHADFRIAGTEVSRLSISDPALHTIPRPSDYYGALIRSSFVASPGNVILVADFSQAELRIYACNSMDPFLLNVYRTGRDLHSEVAIGMYGAGYTKEQRVQCKMFNFSYVYGGNEYSFAQDSGLNISVARQFVKDYNGLMPVALEWKREQLHLARTQGFVQTRFGRRRRFPFITTETLDEARKSSVHFMCASPASDLTLMSVNSLVKQKVPVVLSVHDSILVDCPAYMQNEVAELMVSTMTGFGNKYFPEIPWEADINEPEERHRWAEPLPQP